MTDPNEGWAERRGTPKPGTPIYYYSEGHDALLRADVWLWQVGGIWRACPLHEVCTWWDGSDRVEVGAPIDWCRSILDIPDDGGVCFWWEVDA